MATTSNGTTASAVLGATRRKQRQQSTERPRGIKTYKQVVTLATADLALNVKSTILTFPDVDAQLIGLRIKMTDGDTNVSPTVRSDFILDNSAGTTIVTLIAASDAGVSGGIDEQDANLDPTLLNTNGLVLKHKTQAAAATAAITTLTVYVTVNFDLLTTF